MLTLLPGTVLVGLTLLGSFSAYAGEKPACQIEEFEEAIRHAGENRARALEAFLRLREPGQLASKIEIPSPVSAQAVKARTIRAAAAGYALSSLLGSLGPWGPALALAAEEQRKSALAGVRREMLATVVAASGSSLAESLAAPQRLVGTSDERLKSAASEIRSIAYRATHVKSLVGHGDERSLNPLRPTKEDVEALEESAVAAHLKSSVRFWDRMISVLKRVCSEETQRRQKVAVSDAVRGVDKETAPLLWLDLTAHEIGARIVH